MMTHHEPIRSDEKHGRPPRDDSEMLSAILWRRYEQELEYYHADAPYLPLDKCAQRTRRLSVLYTLAQLSSQTNTDTERRVNV